jgi:8-oxo-dGTP pyrophosphatase MutT (NUDIX family)
MAADAAVVPEPVLCEAASSRSLSSPSLGSPSFRTGLDSSGVLRTYDSEDFRRRAGVVCLRRKGLPAPHKAGLPTEWEMLLLTSISKRNHYVFPAGGIDPGEDESQAAQREAMEEGGIRGRLSQCVIVENKNNMTRTHLFIMLLEEELDDWPEKSFRLRHWVALNEAQALLAKNTTNSAVSALELVLPHITPELV